MMAESMNVMRSAILDAIDHLRGRRFRPDKNRIVEVVMKSDKVSCPCKQEILTQLSKAVEEDAVIKVRYKDGFSYRNPARMPSRNNQVPSNDDELLEVQRTLAWVLKMKQEASDSSPFSMTFLLDKIKANDPNLKVDDLMVEDLMEEEVASGKC
jgi:hypothetical protein